MEQKKDRMSFGKIVLLFFSILIFLCVVGFSSADEGMRFHFYNYTLTFYEGGITGIPITANTINAYNVTSAFWLNASDQRYNETSLIVVKAGTGNCADGYAVQNTTTTGVQCTSLTSSGGDGNNYSSGISVTGTGTKTIQISRVGMSNISASFIDDDDDTTYTAGTGLTLATTTFSLNTTYTNILYATITQYNNLYTNVSDLQTFRTGTYTNFTNMQTSITGNATSLTNEILARQSIGNWSSDKNSYNTTVQNALLYYPLSNPSGFYNFSTSPVFNNVTVNGNVNITSDCLYLNGGSKICGNSTSLQLFSPGSY